MLHTTPPATAARPNARTPSAQAATSKTQLSHPTYAQVVAAVIPKAQATSSKKKSASQSKSAGGPAMGTGAPPPSTLAASGSTAAAAKKLAPPPAPIKQARSTPGQAAASSAAATPQPQPSPRICKGRVANLESNVPASWWTTVFDDVYLATDGDVVEDPEVTRSEVDLLESYPYLRSVFRRGMARAGGDQPPRILDLCCGQGRHALELARRYPRLEIYGYDQSEFLVTLAQERARAQGVEDRVHFSVGDCRTIPYSDNVFDLVMVMGNSFGYFTSTASDLQVLRECHRVSKVGAYVVLDLTDGHYMKHSYSPRTWEWLDDTMFVCRERSLTADGKCLVSREVVTNVDRGVVRDQFYAERLYELDEVEMLMEMALYTPAREMHARANMSSGGSAGPSGAGSPPISGNGSAASGNGGAVGSGGARARMSSSGGGGSSNASGSRAAPSMAVAPEPHAAVTSAGGEVITAAKDLSKRQEDLGMMEQRMLIMACKERPGPLGASAAAGEFVRVGSSAAPQQQQQRPSQHRRGMTGELTAAETETLVASGTEGDAASDEHQEDADDEFDSSGSETEHHHHHQHLAASTATGAAASAAGHPASPTDGSHDSGLGSSSPMSSSSSPALKPNPSDADSLDGAEHEPTALLTCGASVAENHVGGLLLALGHATAPQVRTVTSPVPAPAVRRLVVVLGDPRSGCTGKLNDTWNPEDFATRTRLVEAIEAAGPWRREAQTLVVMDEHSTLIGDLSQLAQSITTKSPTTDSATTPDTLVINLCDEGYANDALQELHVPALLEMLRLPYTGAGPTSLGLCYDKALVAAQARAMGIPTPREAYYLGSLSMQARAHSMSPRAMDAMVREVDGLTYPAFVKPMRGDNSLGITPRSLVRTPEELHAYVCELDDAGMRDIIIQEYLPGSEFSVGVIGNPATGFFFLPILQVDYSAIVARGMVPILGFESKWDPTSPYWNDIGYQHADHLPRGVVAALHARCAALFERFGCRDYARFDFRSASPSSSGSSSVDEEERADDDAAVAARIKLLEVNPNPGWCWDGKLAHMARIAGLDYADMLMMVVQAGVHRITSSL
ncbi:hypothetical protein BC828DRAFT_409566 [Blastocladiella britannica]|nr:hypothetical protein BC828DRAFT_409566 [Blastocladiella britannica]